MGQAGHNGGGVEGLVGVQVDTDPVALRDGEDLVGRGGRVGVDVGRPSRQVGATLERLVEDASVDGAGLAAQRRAHEGHDLHVGQSVARGILPKRHQGLERCPTRGLVEVHVGAHGRGAVQHQVLEHGPRGPEDLLGRTVGELRRPCAHRAHQVGRRVGGGGPGAGLVEVGVGLDGRVEHDQSGAVDDLLPRSGAQIHGDLGDRARHGIDADVGAGPVGHPATHEEGHRTSSETPTLGRISSASACSCSSMRSRPSPGSSGNTTRWSSSSRSIQPPMVSATSS
jgi:hypothetical protein